MNKKLNSWEEVKAYLEYILYDKRGTRALCYTSTSGYLQPFINDVEKSLKALEIIKEKVEDMEWLMQSIKMCVSLEKYNDIVSCTHGKCLTQDEYELLREVLL